MIEKQIVLFALAVQFDVSGVSYTKFAHQYDVILTPLINCRCLLLYSLSLTINTANDAGMNVNASEIIILATIPLMD